VNQRIYVLQGRISKFFFTENIPKDPDMAGGKNHLTLYFNFSDSGMKFHLYNFTNARANIVYLIDSVEDKVNINIFKVEKNFLNFKNLII